FDRGLTDKTEAGRGGMIVDHVVTGVEPVLPQQKGAVDLAVKTKRQFVGAAANRCGFELREALFQVVATAQRQPVAPSGGQLGPYHDCTKRQRKRTPRHCHRRTHLLPQRYSKLHPAEAFLCLFCRVGLVGDPPPCAYAWSNDPSAIEEGMLTIKPCPCPVRRGWGAPHVGAHVVAM